MKKLFLTLAVAALAFTACEGDDHTSQDLTIRATSVFADPSVKVTTVKASNPINGAVIGTGSFKGNGFTMTIPATLPADALLAWMPLGLLLPKEIEINDPNVMYFQIEFNCYNSDYTYSIGSFRNQDTNSQIDYWYVDRDVTIKGYYIYAGQTYVYDLTLTKGLNKVLESRDLTTTTATSPVPCGTNVGWSFSLPVPPI